MVLFLNGFIDLYSFFILLIIYQQLRKSDGAFKIQHSVLVKMIQLIMFLLLIDIGSRFDGNPNTLSEVVNRLSNFLMFIFNPLQAMLWAYYIKVQVSQDPLSLRRLRNVFKGVMIANLFLVVANLKYHWFYYIDEYNIYHRGSYFLVPLGLTLLMAALSYWYAISNREKFTARYFSALMLFAIPPLFCLYMQYLIYGSSLILSGVTISLLTVFLNSQNQRVYTDFLTGAYNRTKLESYLSERIASVHRKGKTFSAIMIDLDDFKNINDTLGHDIGDLALETAAKVLKSCIREEDILARYGGDEFCMILDIIDEEELEAMVDRIRDRIRMYNDSFRLPFRLEVSMGYAVYDPSLKMNVDTFKRLIDFKMYQEKRIRKANGVA